MAAAGEPGTPNAGDWEAPVAGDAGTADADSGAPDGTGAEASPVEAEMSWPGADNGKPGVASAEACAEAPGAPAGGTPATGADDDGLAPGAPPTPGTEAGLPGTVRPGAEAGTLGVAAAARVTVVSEDEAPPAKGMITVVVAIGEALASGANEGVPGGPAGTIAAGDVAEEFDGGLTGTIGPPGLDAGTVAAGGGKVATPPVAGSVTVTGVPEMVIVTQGIDSSGVATGVATGVPSVTVTVTIETGTLLTDCAAEMPSTV